MSCRPLRSVRISTAQCTCFHCAVYVFPLRSGRQHFAVKMIVRSAKKEVKKQLSNCQSALADNLIVAFLLLRILAHQLRESGC